MDLLEWIHAAIDHDVIVSKYLAKFTKRNS